MGRSEGGRAVKKIRNHRVWGTGKPESHKQIITWASNNPVDTIEGWTGGTSYKRLFAIELFGFKVEFWRKLT